MRIALVDGTKKHTYYPFGLMRISSYLKAKGNDVALFYKELPRPSAEWDEVWISAIFSFEIPYVRSLVLAYAKYSLVRVGGVSPTIMPEAFQGIPCEISTGKLDEAEKYQIDYNALGFKPEYSMSKITDGCIRNCKFCVVPKIEPEYTERDWKRDIRSDTKYVVFSDNNYLARGADKLREDLAYFQNMVHTTSNKYIDFNQGNDCRLVTPEIADIIAKMPIKPYRFSYDGPQEDGYIETAITLLAERGCKDFSIYILYNFMDTIQEIYKRMRAMVNIAESKKVSVCIFPMRYQPIDMIDSGKEYTGKHWDDKAKKGFMTALNHHSIFGQFSFKNRAAFEGWLTDSPEKFVALLHYPDIAKYFSRKKEAQRELRDRTKALR